MAYFNTGTVTVDKNLKLLKGDKGFFALILWENSHFLEQSVYKDDFAEVKATCDKVWETGEKMFVTYRVFSKDERIHWVVCCVEKVKLAGDDVLELSIQSVVDLELEISAMQDELCELGTYMDIMDELFFRYDVEKDDFSLFMGAEKQRVVVYSGDLDSWEQSLEEKDAFEDEKYRETFENLCQDLQQASRHFSHEIMLPHLVRGDEKELYLIKGRSVVTASGRELVLGCVYTLSKNSRRRKNRMGADAVRDEMTGLLSKQTIIDYIQSTMAAKPEYTCYLCVMDVDNFKFVNDHYGHMFGDEVLITVADILKEAVGERGVVGRIGGDEMIIFLERIADRADLKSILRTVRSNVEWAYKGVKEDLNLSCSIGAAAWPDDAQDYDTLFKIADKMLYRAKENGRNRYIIYTPEIHGDVLNVTPTDAPAVERRKMISAGNKDRFMLELTEYFIFRTMWKIQMVLEETGTVFGLSEVNVFYDEPAYDAMHWRADGKPVEEQFLSYAGTTQFRQLFDDNNLMVVDDVANLQFACKDAYEALKEHQVTAALIYRMEGNVPGYITFYKTETATRLWPDSEKAYLNLIGKMIALYISGR